MANQEDSSNGVPRKDKVRPSPDAPLGPRCEILSDRNPPSDNRKN